MTVTRDRGREVRATTDSAVASWGERSALGSLRGWPWWGAVVLALVLGLAGALVDQSMNNSIGIPFEAVYLIGCAAAVCLVRRKSLFGPMVQPPLILVVAVPVAIVVVSGLPSGSGRLLTLGTPLINAFPVMAITTALTLVIGGIRFLTQRKPVDAGAGSAGAARPSRRPGAGRGPDRDRDRDGRDGARGRMGRPDRAGGARAQRQGDGARRAPDRTGQDRGADRGNPDRIRDRGGQGQRPERRGAPDRRGQDRSTQDRGGQDRGAAPRDRTRVDPPRGSRGGTPDRGGRGGVPRGGADRGQPRGGRDPRREPPRRQPPPPRRRRDDDYYD